MRILKATRAALMTQLDIDKTLLLVRDGGPRHLAVSNVSALSATQRSLLVSQRTQMLHSLSKLPLCALWPVLGLALRAPGFAAAHLGRATPEPLLSHSWLKPPISASFNTQRLEDHIPLCPYLSVAGFDAVRLLRRDDDDGDAMGEVVDCRPQCTAAYLKGACVDGLRAGWGGRRPCECNDSFPVLNCFGTRPPPWRARRQASTRCRSAYGVA